MNEEKFVAIDTSKKKPSAAVKTKAEMPSEPPKARHAPLAGVLAGVAPLLFGIIHLFVAATVFFWSVFVFTAHQHTNTTLSHFPGEMSQMS